MLKQIKCAIISLNFVEMLLNLLFRFLIQSSVLFDSELSTMGAV